MTIEPIFLSPDLLHCGQHVVGMNSMLDILLNELTLPL